MQLFLRIFLLCLLFFALLGGCAGVRAQTQDPSGGANANGTKSVVVPKPVRKPDQVTTDDSIALLAVRRTPETVAGARLESGGVGSAEPQGVPEITELQQQIKDKQKRIALLMRLFVEDERQFVIDPGNVTADPAAAERRRYEQDELRWETAELAKLKARLEELRPKQ